MPDRRNRLCAAFVHAVALGGTGGCGGDSGVTDSRPPGAVSAVQVVPQTACRRGRRPDLRVYRSGGSALMRSGVRIRDSLLGGGRQWAAWYRFLFQQPNPCLGSRQRSFGGRAMIVENRDRRVWGKALSYLAVGIALVQAAELTAQSDLPLVIMMDSPHPARVYDEETLAVNGTNADVVNEILSDLPLRREREPIGPHWQGDREILRLDPDLIVIHYSGFREEDGSGPRERLKLFVSHFGDSEARFLIYSRAEESFLRQRVDDLLADLDSQYPGLLSRISVFGLDDHGPPSWRSSLTANALERRVREILGVGLQPETIRQYQLEADGAELRLVMTEAPRPAPGENEVLVRVRATSLNRRDLSILRSRYGGDGNRDGLVPLSDGAGEVIAAGPGVTRFEVGDRVAGTFFERWVDGRRNEAVNASARGGSIDGMLSEMVVSHEDGLVLIPEHLTFEEAATLPCAAVTAWNALVTHGQLQPDDFVLLEGTGGVSIFGLQFSAAAGARPIITSSSDLKLDRTRELGAFGTVNYRTNPEWQEDVRALTADAGVSHVLEVGGRETLPRAVQALGFGGHIALIGGLSGSAPSLPIRSFIGLGASTTAIYVGSRADFEAMNDFISEHQLRPIVDRVFSFEEASAAYDYMASEGHLGKIVIRL